MPGLSPAFRRAAGHMARTGPSTNHLVYHETYGNQENGEPYFVVHGNAGYTIDPERLTAFDPDRHYVVMIHQRGVGKSLPFGETRDNDFPTLVEDIEAVRQELGLDKINFLAWSGGTSQALLYAETYPRRTGRIIAYAPFYGSGDDLHMYFRQQKNNNPEAWHRLMAYHGAATVMDLIRCHAEACLSDTPEERLWAAVYYYAMGCPPEMSAEDVYHAKTPAEWDVITRTTAVHAAQMREAYGLGQDQIHRERTKIAPDTTINFLFGQNDRILQFAPSLARSWERPGVYSAIVPGAGHDIHEPAVQDALRDIVNLPRRSARPCKNPNTRPA